MKYFHKQKCSFINPVITMGTFDGIHLGHQKLLAELRKRADARNAQAVVVTYYHHPLETIHRKTFPYLLTERDKKEELLKKHGVDCVLYLDFDSEMAKMGAEEFLRKVIIESLHPAEIIVGYDTHFGKKREGDFPLLKKLERKYNYTADLISAFAVEKEIVSSSKIRDLIREGDMQKAKTFLGRDYSILGKVIKGHKVGRTLGFPTINLEQEDPNKLIPALGVYVSKVIIDGKIYDGVTNVGYSPTIKTTGIKEVETHLLEFCGDLYSEKIELIFLKRIRDEIKFNDVDQLINQIEIDVKKAKEFLATI